MEQQHFDIAVIGLGPVGCTAALLLAEAGLRVVAFERDETVYALPRAVNLDGEIIRSFQKVGRGQVVQDLMQVVRPGDRAGFANSKREWLFGQSFVDFGTNGWQPMNMFDQPEFEGYLRDEVLTHPGVVSYIGAEVSEVVNQDAGVRISFSHPGEPSGQCTARYAIAADGASSQVRKSMNIGWRDLGYDHNWLVVDVTLKAGHTLNNDTVQVCDPDRIVTYVCTKDPYRRWEFKMNPGETAEQMLEEETILSLIDPWTPRGTYEIRRAAVYQFHAATADRWRVGNIFIAGDAAHQTPPFLGQGMNAGMRDVINLAWKFPLVFNQIAEDTLLDTYYTERNAHAHDLVDWAVSIGRLMEHMAETERCEREGLPAPDASTNQASGYGQGREQPPIRDGAVLIEQVSNKGSTGYLLPQPIVRNPAGETMKFDELLGDGFAVIAQHESDLQMSTESMAVLEKLGARKLSLEGLASVKGKVDKLLEPGTAVIVRPDRIVFGHTSGEVSLDQLITRLAEKLSIKH
jgi:3-(3-hydroxy-phenyl)propionate hydroxylase